MSFSRAKPKSEIFSTLFSPTSTFLQARSLWTMPNADRNSCLIRREGEGPNSKLRISQDTHETTPDTNQFREALYYGTYRIGQFDFLYIFYLLQKFMNREGITPIAWFCLSRDSDRHKARTHIEAIWLPHIWGLVVDGHRWSVYIIYIYIYIYIHNYSESGTEDQ